MGLEGELVNSKRRLPLWMSSSSSSSTTSITTTTKRKETSIEIEDGEEPTTTTTKVKTRAGATRKRAKKETPQIHHHHPNVEQTKKQVANKATNTRKQEDMRPTVDSVSTQEAEDDEDLTVDDLITIAQQYVKADVEKENHPKQQQRLTRRVEPSSESGVGSALTGCTSNDLVESTEVLPTVGNLSDEAVAVSQDTSSRTGDPAQDMLNLFLGPLLKKPTQTQEARKQSEAAACATFRENIALDEYICSHKKQCEEKEEADMRKPEPLPVNVTKKKSSLRDKVAMFFD